MGATLNYEDFVTLQSIIQRNELSQIISCIEFHTGKTITVEGDA